MNRPKYIGYIVLRMLTLLIAVSILSYILVNASPVDPLTAYVGSESTLSEESKEEIAEHWKLNEPPVKRFFTWAENTLRGDLGESITYRMSVAAVIADRFTHSLGLILAAWVLSGVLGFAAGILAALKRGSWLDKGIKTVCLIFQSAPVFWFGLLMVTVFAVSLGWFPMGQATITCRTAPCPQAAPSTASPTTPRLTTNSPPFWTACRQ